MRTEVAMRVASERYPELKAHVADVLALPFDDASFDVVVSNSTLDHSDYYEKLRAAGEELARCQRPGWKGFDVRTAASMQAAIRP
jgi:ubiquinone/menaquinone biosynthesis C-methylase UbiE